MASIYARKISELERLEASCPKILSLINTKAIHEKLTSVFRFLPHLAFQKCDGLYFQTTHLLVRRYICAEETRKHEHTRICEDDVNQIRQDTSSFRFELLDILKLNGMQAPTLKPNGHFVSGRRFSRKGINMARRLLRRSKSLRTW